MLVGRAMTELQNIVIVFITTLSFHYFRNDKGAEWIFIINTFIGKYNPPHKLETSISGGKPYVNAGYILQTLQLQTFNLSFLCANCLWQISVEASKLTQNKDLELDTVQSV